MNGSTQRTAKRSQFDKVFFEDFDGTQLDRSIWETVCEADYHNGMFSWSDDQVSVGNGQLTIGTEREGGDRVSGGVSTIPDGITYGRYDFRALVEQGQGTAGVILLWPTSNRWTDEVDITETHRPDRSAFAFTNHGHPNEPDCIAVDVSQWHTYTLVWKPGLLKVDGRKVAVTTHDVPDQPMAFGVQGMVLSDSEWWFGGGPDHTTPSHVDLKVDWVRVSEWTGDWGG